MDPNTLSDLFHLGDQLLGRGVLDGPDMLHAVDALLVTRHLRSVNRIGAHAALCDV